MFFRFFKAIGMGIKGIGIGIRKFWQGKVCISGSAVIITILVVAGFFGGRLSAPAPASVPPSASAPVQKPAPAPSASTNNTSPSPATTTVSGQAPATTAPAQTAPPQKPPSTPKPAPAPKLILLSGDFKAITYTLGQSARIKTYSGESNIDTNSGPLSRVAGSIKVKWTGTFSVQSAGQYEFDFPSGADLYVDKKRVVEPIYLNSGTHELSIGPYLKSAGSPIQLMWQKIG